LKSSSFQGAFEVFNKRYSRARLSSEKVVEGDALMSTEPYERGPSRERQLRACCGRYKEASQGNRTAAARLRKARAVFVADLSALETANYDVSYNGNLP
jgi:hypothetical protein